MLKYTLKKSESLIDFKELKGTLSSPLPINKNKIEKGNIFNHSYVLFERQNRHPTLIGNESQILK